MTDPGTYSPPALVGTLRRVVAYRFRVPMLGAAPKAPPIKSGGIRRIRGGREALGIWPPVLRAGSPQVWQCRAEASMIAATSDPSA